MARAKDSVDDAARSIGNRLLPALTEAANWVALNAGPAMDTFGAVASDTATQNIQRGAFRDLV